MEPGQEGAGLPVLRHHLARAGRIDRHRRRKSSSSTIWSRPCAAFPTTQRGWQAKKTSVKCQSCQAISVFDAERVGPALRFLRLLRARALRGDQGGVPPGKPAADEDQRDTRCATRSAAGIGSRWFAPNKLKHAALTDTVKGLYIPYWTFDAQVHADWTAESGYYYYETETYHRRQRHRPRRGRCRRSAGSPAAARWITSSTTSWCPPRAACNRRCCATSSRFPTRGTCALQRGFLSGWVVERYQIDLVERRARGARRNGRRDERLCAARSARRHPPQPASETPITPARPSSTSSCPSGCSPTTTARAHSR